MQIGCTPKMYLCKFNMILVYMKIVMLHREKLLFIYKGKSEYILL